MITRAKNGRFTAWPSQDQVINIFDGKTYCKLCRARESSISLPEECLHYQGSLPKGFQHRLQQLRDRLFAQDQVLSDMQKTYAESKIQYDSMCQEGLTLLGIDPTACLAEGKDCFIGDDGSVWIRQLESIPKDQPTDSSSGRSAISNKNERVNEHE